MRFCCKVSIMSRLPFKTKTDHSSLSSARTDEQLERSVTEAFKEYGNVYVKIRRDNNMMPFAFCQYETVQSARAAIQFGKNRLIDGRRCRTEPARVNRSLYMSKVLGGRITNQEAHSVLQRFGPIEKTWEASPTEQEIYQLPDGIWVKFAYYQACRDAQSAFRDDQEYRLDQPPTPPDAPSKQGRSMYSLTSSPFKEPSPGAIKYWERQAIAKKNEDVCTVFVGDIPSEVTQEEIIDFFGQYGCVVSAQIISRPSANGKIVNNEPLLSC
ncbi:hypothetical protein L228DRAFT_29236 [Xylona heveae TC161]|uniref:RRM domain-containing protein n=1 Tax=Xylona heveae (strain CBS 132557 / TC161) TaxID=1328760 RepID=A0A165AHU2_XYLHT|nr:hypothetical protein L228DRAFT_29236 [Xylona heveae TC161]KZF20498.1 hypothetical protein L228DRAFT_29236 [Xylona heveae TC161]